LSKRRPAPFVSRESLGTPNKLIRRCNLRGNLYRERGLQVSMLLTRMPSKFVAPLLDFDSTCIRHHYPFHGLYLHSTAQGNLCCVTLRIGDDRKFRKAMNQLANCQAEAPFMLLCSAWRCAAVLHSAPLPREVSDYCIRNGMTAQLAEPSTILSNNFTSIKITCQILSRLYFSTLSHSSGSFTLVNCSKLLTIGTIPAGRGRITKFPINRN
jgi:hypothetical protein